MNIPFVFSSNGDGFVFHDRTGASDPRERLLALDGFPSPADLWARYRDWKGIDRDAERIVLQDYYDDGSGNPHTIVEDHGDPDTLLADLTAAEAEVAAIRDQLKAILTEALAR